MSLDLRNIEEKQFFIWIHMYLSISTVIIGSNFELVLFTVVNRRHDINKSQNQD